MMKKKRKLKKDPHAKREAEKYDKPIASREFILQLLESSKEPLNRRQIAELLHIEDEDAKIGLKRRLNAMVRDGQVERLSKKRFIPVGHRRLLKGKVWFDKDRTPWLIPEDNSAKVKLPKTGLRLEDGFRLIVSVPEGDLDKTTEAKIIEILQQTRKQVTGRFVQDSSFQYVIAHSRDISQDILIPDGYTKEAKDGDIVVVEMVHQQSRWREPLGHVVELLGNENEKGIEIRAALYAYGIPEKWPEKVLNEISGLKETVTPHAMRGRFDLRELPLITIDGEDAKDFDDAVYCERRRGGGFKLYVAIADVSHYVKVGSGLDKEAQKRGNSVYFPTQVVPMLPEVLSNGLCSLNPEVTRLCMVCEMNISKHGAITRYEFYEGVMCSHARMTYTQVAKIVNKESKHLLVQHEALVPHLNDLHELYQVLRKARTERGAIDFESKESRIIFSRKGKIKHIEPIERNVAHKMIEECMLAANVATAKFLKKYKLPGLYRVHEGPSPEKLNDLKTFLKEIGLSFGRKKKPEPLDYGNLLTAIKDRPDAHVIETVLLRSLSQAIYSKDNLGHFGLAYPAYTHFTSPIRRYPDLLVHRQIKAVLREQWPVPEGKKPRGFEVEPARLEEFANHCSYTERRADEATRDVVRWLKCQYMQAHLGEMFHGVISGVTNFGFFVELEALWIDGLVHVTDLGDDYFVFHSAHHRLVGEASGVEYSLGMRVEVQVSRVDVDERKIDFKLVSAQSFKKRTKKKKRKKQRSTPRKRR